jgi:hypothetical protein
MREPCRPIRRLLAGALLLALGAGRLLAGEEVQVPADLQAALFVKILSFDRNLRAQAGKDIVLGVLLQRGNRVSLDIATDLMRAVEGLAEPSETEPRLRAVPIDVGRGDLAEQLEALHVEALYVPPLRALAVADIAAAARRRGVRTLTGVAAYVREGLAVGLAVRDDRPEILVNLPEARAEGTDFSSQLLNLARVIR